MKKRIILWVKSGPLYLLSIVIFFMTICLFFKPFKDFKELFGLIFTIFGTLVVFIQLECDYKEYKDRAPVNFSGWFSSIFKKTINFSAKAFLSGKPIVDKPTLLQRREITDNDLLEEKINKIIMNLSYINTDIANVINNQNSLRSDLTERIQYLETEIGVISKGLNSRLAKHVIGSYQITFFGLFLTICGVILSFNI